MSALSNVKKNSKRQREKELEDRVVDRVTETIVDVLPIIIEEVTKMIKRREPSSSVSIGTQVKRGSRSKNSHPKSLEVISNESWRKPINRPRH